MIIDGDEDVLSNLIKCLSAIENRAQKSALRLLWRLLDYCVDRDFITQKLIQEDLLIQGLLMCMFVIDDHDLQEHALGFLGYLWKYSDSSKESFADDEYAIRGLVACMSATDKPFLQLKAIRILVNLASSKKDDLVREEIAAQIFKENGAGAGFVKNLSANCDLHKQTAAAAVANLAEVDGATVKQRIIDEDGAISGLVECLSSTSFRLKSEATRALQNITKGRGACWKRRKIVPKLENK